MKKVLFISYCFPPLLRPNSIQIARLASHLLSYGWRPTVLSVDTNYSLDEIDNSLSDLVHNSIEIIRFKSLEPKLITGMLWRIFKPALMMPDSKIGWYLYATRRPIESKSFNLIFSCAYCWSSHIVGLSFKKKTGLPWVAYFSDPWVDNPYHEYSAIDRYVNKRMEKAVIETADAIVFVTEEMKKLVMRKYPSNMLDKAFVIPHCYGRKLFARFERNKQPKFTLTHTGHFYYGKRTPVALFQALSNIIKKYPNIPDSLNVQLVGGLHRDYRNMVSELGIDKIVSVVDMVPYLESLEYILNADVLLLIDAPSEGPSVFLPSKLIEYIGSGNPVLGITPLQGASATVIRKLKGIVVAPEDIDGIEKSILNFYEKYKQGRLSEVAYPEGFAQQYNAINTTKTLAKLFDDILCKNRNNYLRGHNSKGTCFLGNL